MIPSDLPPIIPREPTTARSHTLRGVRLPDQPCPNGRHRDTPGKDAMRDCQREGHIRIDTEKACLSCEFAIQAGDKVAYHVHRCTTCAGYHPRGTPHQGEMLALGDTADPREWGTAG